MAENEQNLQGEQHDRGLHFPSSIRRHSSVSVLQSEKKAQQAT
jgi:hypothetical protein